MTRTTPAQIGELDRQAGRQALEAARTSGALSATVSRLATDLMKHKS